MSTITIQRDTLPFPNPNESEGAKITTGSLPGQGSPALRAWRSACLQYAMDSALILDAQMPETTQRPLNIRSLPDTAIYSNALHNQAPPSVKNQGLQKSLSYIDEDCIYNVPKMETADVSNSNNKYNTLSKLERQPWYFDKITRVKSEAVLKKKGDFLVRASISSPGEYVLTAHDGDRRVHFQINRSIDKSINNNRPTTLYHFEEEQFNNVVDLIDFYRDHRKPITDRSKCLILQGIARTDVSPRSSIGAEIEASYALVGLQARTRARHAPMPPPKPSFPTHAPIPLAPTRPLPPPPVMFPAAHHTATMSPLERRVLLSQAKKQLTITRRYGSESHLKLTGLYDELNTIADNNEPQLQHQNGIADTGEEQHDYCDIDYSDMDADTDPIINNRSFGHVTTINQSPFTTLPTQPISANHVISANQSASSIVPPPPIPDRPLDRDSACVMDMPIYDRLGNNNNNNSVPVPMKNLPTTPDTPPPVPSSPSQLPSQLQPCKNPTASLIQTPLNQLDLNRIKSELLVNSSTSIAALITKEDCRLLCVCGDQKVNSRRFEQIFALNGANLRADVLERSSCIRNLVSTTVLMTNDLLQCSRLIEAWIEIADVLMFGERNSFGFVNVMSAICSVQVQHRLTLCRAQISDSVCDKLNAQLKPKYHQLLHPQEHLDKSINYRLPNILPIIQLINANQSSHVISQAFSDWSKNLNPLLSTLLLARKWLETPPICSGHALCGRKSGNEELLLESTERCNWALYGKFTNILSLKQRCEMINSVLEKF